VRGIWFSQKNTKANTIFAGKTKKWIASSNQEFEIRATRYNRVREYKLKENHHQVSAHKDKMRKQHVNHA
jgi:hypothetical protein